MVALIAIIEPYAIARGTLALRKDKMEVIIMTVTRPAPPPATAYRCHEADDRIGVPIKRVDELELKRYLQHDNHPQYQIDIFLSAKVTGTFIGLFQVRWALWPAGDVSAKAGSYPTFCNT